MRRIMVSMVCAALGVTVLGRLALSDADEVAKGRELAGRLCAQCHMNPGQGEKSGPAGIPGFSAVANRPGQSTDGVVAWLKMRPPMMPNHHLSQEEMYRLAAFIMSLRQEP
jgi:mono/diheme cytochrome c family protein